MDAVVDRRPARVDARRGRGRAARAAAARRCACRGGGSRGPRPPNLRKVRTRRDGRATATVRAACIRSACHARRAAPRPAPRARVDEAFRTLPERYLGAPDGLRRDLPRPPGRRRATPGRSAARTHGARVRKGCTRREPDVVIGTDAADVAGPARRASCRASTPSRSACSTPAATSTWPSASRACSACPTAARRCCASTTCALPGRRVSTLTMGDGPDVLLHPRPRRAPRPRSSTPRRRSRARATASTRSTCPASAARPSRVAGPYSARWFADTVVEVMDALDIERAHLVGNSMGGRVAIEVGLRAPERVAGLALLAPGRGLRQARLAPDRAPAAPRARPAAPQPRPQPRRAPVLEPVRRPRPGRPQRGRRRRRRVPAHLRERRARGSPSSPRRATSTSTAPSGAAASTRGWPSSRRPSLFVWGACDRLIPPGFKRHVAAVAARRRADRPRGLRPRPAGRALRADDRPAAALLRARRRARRRAARGRARPRRRHLACRGVRPALPSPPPSRCSLAAPGAPRRGSRLARRRAPARDAHRPRHRPAAADARRSTAAASPPRAARAPTSACAAASAQGRHRLRACRGRVVLDERALRGHRAARSSAAARSSRPTARGTPTSARRRWPPTPPRSWARRPPGTTSTWTSATPQSEYGIPYALVGADQRRVPIAFGTDGADYGDESDHGPFPIPPERADRGRAGRQPTRTRATAT